MLGVTEWGGLVEISFEPNEITQTARGLDCDTKFKYLVHARCKSIVQDDIHPSGVDLCDRISPSGDVTKMVVE
jgi:hypothetical protein